MPDTEVYKVVPLFFFSDSSTGSSTETETDESQRFCVFTDADENNLNDSFPEQNQSDIVGSAVPNLTVGGQNLSDLPNSDIVEEIKTADTLPENHFSRTLPPTIVSCVLPEKDFVGNNSTLEAGHLSENFDESNTQHHLKESEKTPLKMQDQSAMLPSNKSSSSPKESVISKTKTKAPTVSKWQHSWALFGFKIEPKEERKSSSPADLLTSRQPTSTSYVKNDGVESFDYDKTPKPETVLNPGSEEKADGHQGLEIPLGNTNQPFTTGSLIHYSWGSYFAFIN